MPKLSAQQHAFLSFWGMVLIAVGLPLSVYLVSVGTFLLAGNWLLEGNYRERLVSFFTDKISLIFAGLFLIHFLGMLWTSDLEYGLKDLRVKLPILILPLIVFTSTRPSPKRIQDILLMFVVACFVGTLASAARMLEITGDELINTRRSSVFISHIRFSLMLTLAFYILVYYLITKRNQWSIAEKIIAFASMIWIGVFILLINSWTAYAAFSVIFIFLLIRVFLNFSNPRLKAFSILILLAISIFTFTYMKVIVDRHYEEIPIEQLKLTVKTANGNYYSHQKEILQRENGHRVWNFVCMQELSNEWTTKSDLDFEGNDLKGQPIKFTVVRYMTSLGLPKDSASFHQLSTQDISNIEHGYTNHHYADGIGISARVDEFLWALDRYAWTENANNSSSMQRWVYLKVGLSIFKDHLFFGVGTGDLKNAYKSSYEKDDQGLEPRFQDISHIQFLSVGIVLGVVGLFFLLAALFYPLFVYKNDFLYCAFFLLILVSFLTDNTLGTQSGVTLFAFFNALLILRKESADIEG